MTKKVLVSVLFLVVSINAWGVSCGLKAAFEFFLPSSGYLLSGAYLQSMTWGAIKYRLLDLNLQANENAKRENSRVISGYYETKEGGTTIIEYSHSRNDWLISQYQFLYSSASLINVWDLLKHNCEVKYDSFKILGAPLTIHQWYDSIYTWGPAAGMYMFDRSNRSNKKIIYNIGNVSQEEIERDMFTKYYLVGIVEEIIFRDLLQAGTYNFLQNKLSWRKKTSWHAAVAFTSILFGLAHSGTAGSADKYTATFFGIWLGYLYQPSPDRFRINHAIAAHSWWDIAVYNWFDKEYHRFGNSIIKTPIKIPIFAINVSF